MLGLLADSMAGVGWDAAIWQRESRRSVLGPDWGFCSVPGVDKGCVLFLCSVSQKSQAGRGQPEHKFLQWVKKLPDFCLL